MNEHDLKNNRRDYIKHSLDEADAGTNPFDLFSKWFTEADDVEQEATAFAITTGSTQPASRMVLLKEVRNNEFVFYTNYNSRKGQDIDENPRVSMLFFWQELQRQVRIEGIAKKVSDIESDEYFYSRPIESQIGAIASTQSKVLKSRETLEQHIDELVERYKHQPIVRPKHWGGYAIDPSAFEFWQGRLNRLHDRFQFELEDGVWIRSRLYP